jgi:hypothetical protein
VSQTDRHVIPHMRWVLFWDEHYQCFIKEVEILLIHSVELIHSLKDILFYNVSIIREEDSNVTIRPRGLLFRSAQDHRLDLLLSERFLQCSKVSRLSSHFFQVQQAGSWDMGP